MNAPESVTVSAVAWALRAATDPTIPANGGAMRPVEVVVPAGSLVAAQPPAAVGAGNVEISQRVADVCLGALAQALPDRVGAASQGTMNNLLIGGAGAGRGRAVGVLRDDGRRAGRPPGSPAAGMSGVHTAMTNTKNTPVEALERALPAAGAPATACAGGAVEPGAAPGGEGIERDLQVLTDATVSLISERRVSQPWGLAGGEPGAVGRTGCCRAATRAGPGGCRTSARCTWRPATSCAC